jgi:DNA-binding response OmpR family regulator
MRIGCEEFVTESCKNYFDFVAFSLDFPLYPEYNKKEIRSARLARKKGGGTMADKRVLLVDDEPLIVKGLRFSLEQEGYEVESAADGDEALVKFFGGQFDLVLLDVMLPKLSGTDVCQRIRERSSVPIIMLTAKGEDMDKILGLEYGADDYMTKPFNVLEVKARIKSVLRRAMPGVSVPEEKKIVRVRDMEVNLVSRSVTLGGKDVKLTAKEFDLLQLFITNRGKVYSRENMLETVWKYDYLGDMRTVDVHIRRLREKIERNTAQPEFIYTKWGVGYYFTDQD